MDSLEKSLNGDGTIEPNLDLSENMPDMMTEPNQDMLDSMQELMAQKAGELFRLCDKEEKGFINKSDMQRLRAELPVSPDQLEVVFDSLDNDGNGFLTLEEFTEGFGSFLGIRSPSASREHYDEENEETTLYEGEAGVADPALEEKHFKEMLHHIGAVHVFQDEDIIKAMWQKLHHEEPDMASTFEEFIARVASDIKRSKVDFQSLEAALLSKNNEHEKEVKKLYEEMELQIKQERERILMEEKAKEKQVRTELEQQLEEKERQLHEILTKHQELEHKLQKLNKVETLTKLENERLLKEKEELEEMLSQSQENLEESRNYIQQMQLQQKDEKRERARAALMLSEGIAIERESLVKQLDLLKDVNKKLRDDKDEAEITEARREVGFSFEEEVKSVESSKPDHKPQPRKKICKQGSVLGKYFPGGSGRSTELVSVDLDMDDLAEVCGDDVDADELNDANVFIPGINEDEDDAASMIEEATSAPEDEVHLSTDQHHPSLSGGEKTGNVGGTKQKKRIKIRSLKRSQPVGADSFHMELAVPKPQRLFKVVFIGDSGVGKSTIIHRFCHQEFKCNFQATIGVDFQVKTIELKDTIVILQLWDTAGQERYRSLTKTYFRKADGVIVVYDVTTESTFTNVRNWMTSVKEEVEPGTVIMLLGNKLDMAEDDAFRPVKEKDGRLLAEHTDMLFYETSAKSGINIKEAMDAFTSLLQEKEDKKLEEGLKLTDSKAKKRCCSR
ncbi:EF-hand calcium-binding domain-containing protein 4B-like isoform X3 [Biomphalaria glabrata]|uniref:EF-hand calcium-binding domain-containing protein 4B-like isoform X3 n=1 Tax=Biomphalaria glabrata TaxID=6526 RepID=A0A9U8DVH8_BIOGL|nr:EF-hand calcium-binding domain-containing protein 4B-like isoform X3 [Biomphalaria glabrata]